MPQHLLPSPKLPTFNFQPAGRGGSHSHRVQTRPRGGWCVQNSRCTETVRGGVEAETGGGGGRDIEDCPGSQVGDFNRSSEASEVNRKLTTHLFTTEFHAT